MLSVLKKARLDSGKTLQEISSDLKIRKRYLAALEDENFSLLPGEVYIKGYLRLYADYLNIQDKVNLELSNDANYEIDNLLIDKRDKAIVNYKHKKQLVTISILMLLAIVIIYPVV